MNDRTLKITTIWKSRMMTTMRPGTMSCGHTTGLARRSARSSITLHKGSPCLPKWWDSSSRPEWWIAFSSNLTSSQCKIEINWAPGPLIYAKTGWSLLSVAKESISSVTICGISNSLGMRTKTVQRANPVILRAATPAAQVSLDKSDRPSRITKCSCSDSITSSFCRTLWLIRS